MTEVSPVLDCRVVSPPEGLVVAFYGDDFTGSTDVMEALEDAGLPTLLFLRLPTLKQLTEFPEVRAVGVAGVSRTMSPQDMMVQLPPVFAALAALGAPLVHYKICSTFDSSPTVGSIGRAIELLRDELGDGPIPLVVGVPQLGRYTAFGTLFARHGAEVHRLDRHPVMTTHPMTPMHEADLRKHLHEQTTLPVTLVDLRALDGSDDAVASNVDAALAQATGIVLLDVDDTHSQRQVGRALHRILTAASGSPVGVVGSSGVEYALGAAWGRSRASSNLPIQPPSTVLVVVGSLASATRVQVDAAREAGFHAVEVDATAIVDPTRGPSARAEAVLRTVTALGSNTRVLLMTPVPGEVVSAKKAAPPRVDGTALATALGSITAEVMRLAEVPRLVVAGGDTSGFVALALDIDALQLIRRLAPGAPLCRAVSSDARTNGLELCFKGGQIGEPDYFIQLAELGTTTMEGIS